MISSEPVKYTFIDQSSIFLRQVINLGKRNSKTLGYLPEGAYLDQAKKKRIVIAYQNDSLLGYCLFRITTSKVRVGITQVCVEPNNRRKGIAKRLLDHVRDKYKNRLNEMLVSCRRDYLEACALYEDY